MSTLERGPSLTEQAAEALRARIVGGALQPGEPLSEIALAAELGVSKTPVREALMQLKRDGLVEIHPQRGTFVFTMTAEQVRQLSEIRGILETAALDLAMVRNRPVLVRRWAGIVGEMRAALKEGDAAEYRALDGAFHRTFVELADNAYLLDAFGTIASRVQALRNRLSLEAELNRSSFADHVAFLKLARAGDRAGAAALLTRHIGWTRDHYVAGLGEPVPAGGGVAGTRARSGKSLK